MIGKALLPPMKWAQRKDRIFLTIELRDIKNEKIDLQAEALKFSCHSDNQSWEFQLNFCDEILVEESKTNLSGLCLQFILIKKDSSKSYWKRLTKETTKFQHITVVINQIFKVDWTKYIDEDDEQEEGGKGLDDWDANKFQDFQGGAQDEDDEEDDGGDLDRGNVDDLEEEQELQEAEAKNDDENDHDKKHDAPQ